jgi:hypothetical protein
MQIEIGGFRGIMKIFEIFSRFPDFSLDNPKTPIKL